ncbi:MAG: DEAD/DEAH box helicase [Pseudomonadaceae bacterium]|nr:DEAD/DEAH box helicase [Pseudomonadaceae bacterium]
MSDDKPNTVAFADLNLPEPLLKALEDVGYEQASPIQAQAIPHLMEGRDILGHAPTGTGKTAAFALPLLARLDSDSNHVQVLCLTPTRELAIQVSEAFQRYANHLKKFHVLPIYGGQEYGGQIRALKRGVAVVVGTPGRVMDHMRKGNLKLGNLQALVLDEADEMLRMGFIDEVQWILEQTPSDRQMALFSATMPKQIEQIARKHLNNPQRVSIKAKTATAETIRQRYWQATGVHKLDALTRILEVEIFDAILIFVRTKMATTELAERLEARGYASGAMNGDMLQKQREQMVEKLKRGKIDILVATDVAARGLDVDRISHVVNYDIPYDTEAYIHRIGRTGRAGRTGEAILFVAPRERRMLSTIERATKQKIELLELPTKEDVNNQRIAKFKQTITDTLAEENLDFVRNIVQQYQQEHNVAGIEIAAALASMTNGARQLMDKPGKRGTVSLNPSAPDRPRRSRQDSDDGLRVRKPKDPNVEMVRYRIEVGRDDGVEPSNIVGAVANEAGLDAKHIGRIEIEGDHSTVELPSGMPRELFKQLKEAWICGKQLRIARVDQPGRDGASAPNSRAKSKNASNKKNKNKRSANSSKRATWGDRKISNGPPIKDRKKPKKKDS